MHTKFPLVLLCAGALIARSTRADVTLVFDDHGAGGGDASSGTYAPGDTITFDIFIDYPSPPPPDIIGMTLFFQSLRNSSYIGDVFTVTALDLTGGALPNPNDVRFPQPMNTGFYGADNAFDLGGHRPPGDPIPPGDYFFGRITFQLSSTAAPGIYTLRSVYAPPGDPDANHGTVVTANDELHGFDVPSASYTVVVPEPASFGLFLLGAIFFASRRRRSTISLT